MELPPSHFPAARAAAVALGYLRYLRGGPGRGLELREVRRARRQPALVLVPDSHGNVPPELEPIHRLAWAASGYLIWQNSTENTKFNLAQVKHVKQVKRSDEDLQFDYLLLLHEMVSQEVLPWQVTLLWHPQRGARVSQSHGPGAGDT